MHVLGTQLHLGVGDDVAHGLEHRKGRAQDDFHVRTVRQAAFDGTRQFRGLAHELVHLPVAGNDFLAHR